MFLDTSVCPTKPKIEYEKDLTLKILNKSADNVKSLNKMKLQMKQLNYQRKYKKQRSLCLMTSQLNKTHYETSMDKIRAVSLSPRSKSGSLISRLLDQKNQKHELIAKSAVDIPQVSSQLFQKDQKKHQISAATSNDIFNKPQIKRKYKTSISPDRSNHINKIIRDNIKKEMQAQEIKRREEKEREISDQRRKDHLMQTNQNIRLKNQEKIQRRKIIKEENDEEVLEQVCQDKIKKQKGSRSSGMDFIEVRKEISQELKNQRKQLDSTFNLQHKYPRPITSIDITNQKQIYIKNENMLMKREKIKKYMKEKAKLIQNRELKQKSQEFQNLEKVRYNLTKLNKFSLLRNISGFTTPALNKFKRNFKRPENFASQKNKYTALRQSIDRNVTPSRIFEQSDASLKQSAKQAISQKNNLYEDSRLSSIESNDQTSNNKTKKQFLSVCFEKSASQKAIRKSLRRSQSPQIQRILSNKARRPISALEIKPSRKRKIKSAPKLHKNKKKQQEMVIEMKMSDNVAATVIQKEVRKYLGGLGFYEARESGQKSPTLISPEHDSINLFINKKTPQKSKSKQSVDFELIEPRSSQKSSIKLHISPQQLKNLVRRERIKDQKHNQRLQTLMESQGNESNSIQMRDASHESQSSLPQSQSSNSIFDRQTFKKYSKNELAELMKSNEMHKLMKFKEECILIREKKEKKLIQKLFKENKMTPKTFQQKQYQIERWVTLQKKEIEDTKIGLKEEWLRALQMIEDTQKNVDSMKKKINYTADSNSFSQTSSRHNGAQTKLPAGVLRSILIDEAPKSFRAGHQEHNLISDYKLEIQILTSRSNHQKVEDLTIHQTASNKKDLTENHTRTISGDIGGIQPSAEFLHRLEQALLPRSSGSNTLIIDDPIDDKQEQFEDGLNKNKLVAIGGLNQILQNELDIISQKSEPMLFDSNPNLDQIVIQQKQRRIKFTDSKEVEIQIPKQQVLNNQLADKITDQLMEQLLKDSFLFTKRVEEVHEFQIDREEKREWVEMRQRHLIEGYFMKVDLYVNEIVDMLLQFEISDISETSSFDYSIQPTDNIHIQFLKLLTQPIVKHPQLILEQIQKSELGTYNHFESTFDQNQFPIVQMKIFLDIEKSREKVQASRMTTADKKQKQHWESLQIFNKCIFDAVNESLMKFRPYGIVGQPMPWSNKLRRIQTKVEISSVDTERLFQMVKQELFRWSQVLCGCIPGPVFYFPNSRSGKDEFQDDIFQEVREKKITNLITHETLEQEHNWLNYEFEETQVRIDLTDMILEQLVQEMVTILNNNN